MGYSLVRFSISALVFLAVIGSDPATSAQNTPSSSTSTTAASTATNGSAQDQVLDKLVSEFKIQKSSSGQKAIVTSPTNYIPYLAAQGNAAKTAAVLQLLHGFEEQRVDVQVTSSQSATSSTSTTNKGSVPWLFGLAVENGALTQSVENSQIVLRGNVANAIAALKFQDYVTSFNKIQEQNSIVRNIAKTSFSITFAPSQTNNSAASPTNETNTFSGFSVHYDLWNHRDPRDPRWSARNCTAGTSTISKQDSKCVWDPVVRALQLAADDAQRFLTLFADQPATTKGGPTPLDEWTAVAEAVFAKLPVTTKDDTELVTATDTQIRDVFQKVGDDLATRVANSPEIIAAEQATVNGLLKASSAKSTAYQTIMNSPTLTLEYTYVRQSTNQIPGSTSTTTMSVASPLPNLSTFNLIWNKYLVASSQLSVNGVAAIFNSLPPGSKGGSMRDVEVTAEVDIPLPALPTIGQSTLTFSGLWMDIINQPLGQQILVNGVPESRTGNIGLFQGKFTIPAGKGTGVKIPIAFTYANRTELIKESEVRGSIGVTFNLDSIFSKPK